MTKTSNDAKTDAAGNDLTTDEGTSAQATDQIQGRAIFSTEITAAGVAVSTAFLAEDGRVFPLPAVFPNLQYALSQIDELRQIVINQFGQAAQVGAQVIAAEIAARGNSAGQADAEAQSEDVDTPVSRGKRSLQ